MKDKIIEALKSFQDIQANLDCDSTIEMIADKIVIPELEFYMILDFPLSRKGKIFVNEPSLALSSEILLGIKNKYELAV